MTDQLVNRRRVRPAGLIARSAAAALDSLAAGAVGALLVAVAIEALRLIDRTTDRVVGITPTAERILAVLVVCVVALLHASWTSGKGGPGRRALAVRVVDATTYATIGLPRALARVAARELVVVGAMMASVGAAFERIPAHGENRTWSIAAWVTVCRLAPLMVSWLLPRGRGLHDLMVHSVVIDVGPTSHPPCVEAVMVDERFGLSRRAGREPVPSAAR